MPEIRIKIDDEDKRLAAQTVAHNERFGHVPSAANCGLHLTWRIANLGSGQVSGGHCDNCDIEEDDDEWDDL